MISALISFSGDYIAQVQFDGPAKDPIVGQLVDTVEFTSDKSCEWTAQFQEVLYRKERHLKLNLKSKCKIGAKPRSERPPQASSENETQINPNEYSEMVLHPEYIRVKDLKMDSASVQISKQHKNVQIKVIDLKF